MNLDPRRFESAGPVGDETPRARYFYGICPNCGDALELRHPHGTARYCPTCAWYEAHHDELCRLCGEKGHPGKNCL